MTSSKFVNKLYSSLAEFVKDLTGRDVQFKKIARGSRMEDAFEKIDNFSEAVAEALNNPTTKVLGVLEPGKIYCLQVDETLDNWDWIESISKGLQSQGIVLVVVGKNMNFVKIPEGYEIKKKEGN